MHDNPEPTEQEHDQTPERVPEEDAMSAPGHEDPHETIDPAEIDA